MSSNQNLSTLEPKTLEPTTDPATAAPCPGAADGTDAPPPSNDNAAPAAVPDTTAMLALPEVVGTIRSTLRRYRVRARDMPDAIADVQVEALEHARARSMPAGLAQWKALTTTVAVHWALDRAKREKARRKYDAGLCEDPDAYARPTLRWEHRDPVDAARYLAVLKDLFDSGQMPEDGAEILQGEADGVSREEIGAELGISGTVVRKRLFRMRAKFRARLAALGMLTLLMLLLLRTLAAPVGEVAAPAPPVPSAEPAPSTGETPAWDAGTPDS